MDATSATLEADLVIGRANLGRTLRVGEQVKRIALLSSGWVVVSVELPEGLTRIGLPPHALRQLGQVQDSLGPALRLPKEKAPSSAS